MGKIYKPSCCYVPGCHSGYKTAIRRNQSIGKRNPTLFSVKNQEELELWSKAIRRVDKKLELGDKVCELHFTEDNIIRYYETVLPDGTVWKLERLRNCLKNGSVPTIFPNSNIKSKKRKFQKALNNKRKSSKTRKISSNEASQCKDVTSSKTPECRDMTSFEDPKCSEVISNMYNDDIFVSAEIVVNGNFQQTKIVSNEMIQTFSYNVLASNLENISKPDSLWGITVHDEFVMCAKWNEDYTLMKRVIIDYNLKIQVYFKNKVFDFGNVKISSVKDLSSVLKEIDCCGICINANNIEKTDCDGYILPNSQTNMCEYCLLIRNWEVNQNRRKKLYWLNKGRNFTKHQTLYGKIHTLNKKNELLKEKLNKIIKIKAIWKLSKQINENLVER